jgi:hypothetical protein
LTSSQNKSDLPPNDRTKSVREVSPDIVAALIRYQMPLRSKLSPSLFGRLIGWVFGLLLTPDRGQVRFLSQAKK